MATRATTARLMLERFICFAVTAPSGHNKLLKAANTNVADEFGLTDDALLLGVAAQLIPRKGHDVLLAAMPAILAEQPRARLLLFGRGPQRDALQHRCDELGLREQVIFAGLRDDMPRVLPSLHLLLHPARMEGLGVALLEAADCGVAIVASAVGGIPEVVRDGVNGRLVPPDDRGLSVVVA